MKNLQEKFDQGKHKMLGYPCNFAYDYQALAPSLLYNLNNVGDPFDGTNSRLNTMDTERKVLAFFADMWEIESEYWGYLTFSGTEGNMEGILIGRERFPEGVLYTSEDTHYSVLKIARMFRMDVVKVPSSANGEMDYEKFRESVDSTRPAIVNANIGTTMKGAVDDVEKISQILQDLGTPYHIHADGALMGFVMPFLFNDLSFAKYISSMSISGHKFLGVPFPCGVFLVDKQYKECVTSPVQYIGSLDATIMGSRNAHAPLFMDHAIETIGVNGFKEDIYRCLYDAQWLTNRMREAGVDAWINKHSITVVFPRPSNAMVKEWSLATEDDISHVVVMQHVTRGLLQEFLDQYYI